MKNVRMTICLMAAVLAITAGKGFGLTLFNDGETHNINSTMDDVWVDSYQPPSMQTTVNLLNGGAIHDPYQLRGFNNSRINISGGFTNWLYAFNNSHVTVSDGSVGYLEPRDNVQVNISGGSVDTLDAYGSSQVTMSSGSVNGFLITVDNVQATISGGSIDNLTTYVSSQVKISSASMNYLYIVDSSRVTMSGGTIGTELGLIGNGKLVLDGSDFAIDGIPVDFGKITSILGGWYNDEPVRFLTGTLANGDLISSPFKIGDYASITLVPEPSTVLLLGLGAVILRRRP